MAYKGSLMVTDDLLLQGLQKCKSLGALAMVHAENGDAVAEGQQRMIDLGITGPEGHALSRPPVVIPFSAWVHVFFMKLKSFHEIAIT
jgi:dihydropyrimidinase